MGKRDLKDKFTDVICLNEECEDYNKISNGNVIDMELICEIIVKLVNFIVKYNKSFTSNFNTISYDLRTNENTVFLDLKIIFKIMILR